METPFELAEASRRPPSRPQKQRIEDRYSGHPDFTALRDNKPKQALLPYLHIALICIGKYVAWYMRDIHADFTARFKSWITISHSNSGYCNHYCVTVFVFQQRIQVDNSDKNTAARVVVVCVFFTSNRSFYSSTSSTPSARADSSSSS